MKLHPACSVFPEMNDDEFDALKADIHENGLLEPIIVKGDQIVDGRHRFKACRELGIKPETREWDGEKGDDAVLNFVLSMNLKRRHLSGSQKAFVALKVEEYFAKHMKVGRPENGPKIGTISGKAVDNAAKSVGVARGYVSDAKKIRKEAPELEQRVMSGELTLPQAKRELKERQREDKREQDRKKIAATPKPETLEGVYSTIVIDPPWDWGDEGDKDQLGRARPTYDTMSIDELEKLPVNKLAADDCHLYLWITNRSLPKGFRLLDAWGFRYITMLTWCKPSIGMGNYFRGSTEHVLFGVKGSLPLKRKDVGTWFSAKRGKGGHSSKPTEFNELVESCSPGAYLEMFARSEREGWVSW